MTDTPNLGLPYLEAAQAQKHVTHNEALIRLDVLVQARVVSIGETTPPGSPADGDVYIPGSGATGAWDDWDWNLAYVADGGWRKIVPRAGWLVWNADDDTHYVFDGAAWVEGLLTPQDAAGVPFTPAGAVAATDVQAAIAELDAEKLPLAGGTMAGPLVLHADPDAAMKAATKQYVDQIIAAQDAMVFKGVIDCSGNPNYPAADRGWSYRVSVAGRIGGGSGVNVEAGDLILCLTDGTASGTQAGVGASWAIIQTNLDGAVIGPASVTDGHVAQFDGTSGKLLKGGKAAPSGAFVGTTDSQTLTNKTLTSPAISSPTGLAKGDVGLGNVDNTSDANKPVSTATQAALNAKRPWFFVVGTILDDAAATVNLPSSQAGALCMLLNNSSVGIGGMFKARPFSSGSGASNISLTGATFGFYGTTLAGTSGADAQFNIGATSARLDFENRTAGSLTLTVYVFPMT